MAEVQLKREGGEQSFANFRQICFDFAYFFNNQYENDKNDFLQTQRIRQLDKYSIRIKYSYLHSSTNRKLFHAFVRALVYVL